MTTYKFVFSLFQYCHDHPQKVGFFMKTEAVQHHKVVASLPPAARELLAEVHNSQV